MNKKKTRVIVVCCLLGFWAIMLPLYLIGNSLFYKRYSLPTDICAEKYLKTETSFEEEYGDIIKLKRTERTSDHDWSDITIFYKIKTSKFKEVVVAVNLYYDENDSPIIKNYALENN